MKMNHSNGLLRSRKPDVIVSRVEGSDVLSPISRLIRNFLTTFGFTVPQMIILSLLSECENGKITQAEIRKLTSMSRINISNALQGLKAEEHVTLQKLAEDPRKQYIFLTEEGRVAFKQLVLQLAHSDTRILSGISEEKLAIAEKTMQRIRHNLTKISC